MVHIKLMFKDGRVLDLLLPRATPMWVASEMIGKLVEMMQGKKI